MANGALASSQQQPSAGSNALAGVVILNLAVTRILIVGD
jgi:hypothetical protein